MKNCLLWTFAILLSGYITLPLPTFAQQPVPENQEVIYTLRETDPPNMAGTVVKLRTISSTNLKEPAVMPKDKRKGTVSVAFIINKKGQLVKPLIQESLGRAYDAEALRIVKLMQNQKFEPGTVNGEPASVLITIPFAFPVKH